MIHGDLNVSNYFVRDDGELSVFDWDQTQRAWYLYDLAQCIWGVTMAVLCGMPMSGTKIDCDLQQYTDWICEAYDPKVDRESVKECVRLRKDFYEKFCRRAQAEGDLPADMAPFINWTVD